jgi:hypothetical protein
MSSVRERWPAGAQFRVVQEGAYLSGWKRHPNISGAFRGWQQDLRIGDVINCLGVGAGFGSDPGYGVHWHVPGVNSVEFNPSTGSAFSYEPAPGYLVPVDEEENPNA